MSAQKVVPVLASLLVIIAVAIVQERSRFFAAVLASMPLTAPLALWVVFTSTGGDHQKAADFAASMVLGVAATLAFVVGTWVALKRGWSLPKVMATGGLIWLVVLASGRLVQTYWR